MRRRGASARRLEQLEQPAQGFWFAEVPVILHLCLSSKSTKAHFTTLTLRQSPCSPTASSFRPASFRQRAFAVPPTRAPHVFPSCATPFCIERQRRVQESCRFCGRQYKRRDWQKLVQTALHKDRRERVAGLKCYIRSPVGGQNCSTSFHITISTKQHHFDCPSIGNYPLFGRRASPFILLALLLLLKTCSSLCRR